MFQFDSKYANYAKKNNNNSKIKQMVAKRNTLHQEKQYKTIDWCNFS